MYRLRPQVVLEDYGCYAVLLSGTAKFNHASAASHASQSPGVAAIRILISAQ